MVDDLLTTGQAARICSVTSETILRWIRTGKLRALRTSGGHNRVPRGELERIQGLQTRRQTCWEYHGKGTRITEDCRRCIAYRSRAHRCWELARVGVAAGHSLRFCRTTCTKCDFYRLVWGRTARVLAFTEDPALTGRLRALPRHNDLELEITETEYELSAIVDSFCPEFVMLDGDLGRKRIRRLSQTLLGDPRIGLEGIILAAEPTWSPPENAGPFLRVPRSFELEGLSGCIREARSKRSGKE